jgi:hypothetical protein
MEAMLDPARFARIHRATIVNFDRIKEVHPWFRGNAQGCSLILGFEPPMNCYLNPSAASS